MKLNQTLNPISAAERKKINENWEEIVRNIHLLDGKISILAGGDEVDEILARIAKATTDAIKATSDANSATGKANTATNNANSATSKANTAASKADAATTNANNKIVEVDQVLADADIKIKAAIKATDDAIVAKRNADTATSKANASASKADVATGKATTSTKQADEATAKAIEATTATLDAIAKAVEATKQATEATEAAITATGKANESADKANAQAEYAKAEGDKTKALTTDLQKAHEDLMPLKNDVVKATADANAATSNATSAYEKIKGWGAATPYTQGATYNKNNVVTFNGSTYQAKNDGVTQAPPTTSASNDDWILLAQRGVDGKGAVASVDGILPDGDGNVTLNHANKIDVATALNNAKKYTDEKIGSVDFTEIENSIADNTGKINAHEAKKDNPHSVTKSQVGLGSVDNVKQATKTEFDAHTKQIASADKLGHVKVGAGLSISDDGALSVKRVPKLFSTYTVIIDETNSNPETALTYADDAVNMQPKSVEFLEFLGAKPCLLKEGKVVGYLNPNDFSKFEDGSTADITSGDAGDVMIEFPKRGINIQRRGTNLYVSMTDELDNPNFSYLAHTKGDKQVDNIYIGAYKGFELDGKLRSLSGKEPTGNKTIGAFRSIAQANGQGYQQSQWYHLVYRQVAYILYAKNLDSQTAIGRGYVDGNSSALTTGSTDKLSMVYGETTGKKSVKVFGIEDFWGNVWEWVDGAGTDSSYNLQVSTENFNDNRSGYKVINNSISSNTDGYTSSPLGGVETGFVPREVEGSTSTYYADQAYFRNDKISRFGGRWYDASTAGAFYLRVVDAPSSVNASFSARLSFS